MNKEMKISAALDTDIDLIIYNADGNTKKQQIQIQQLINSNIDLLIISPNESGPITKYAIEAYKKGIPTIIVDRKITSDEYTAFIGANNYEIGYNAAIYIGNISKGKGNILEIKGQKGSSPSENRHKGFVDGLKRFPDLVLSYSDDGSWLNNEAKRVAKKAFNEKHFDIVFAHNDVMALGAWEVAQERNLQNLFFVGVDALPTLGLNLVTEDKLQASFMYPTGGNKAIELAHIILNGGEFEKINSLHTSVVDASNAQVLKLQQEQMLSYQETLDKQTERIILSERQYNDQRSLLNISLISLSLLVILAIILSYYYLTLSRRRKELEEKNIAIQKQKWQLEKQNNQIKKMNDQVEQATQAKLSFFTNISHEFRTPLTLIQAPVQTMIEQFKHLNLPPSIRENLVLMNRNTERLLRMVNQLMDFRKIELGKASISISRVDIITFIKNIYKAFGPLARQKNIDFFLDKNEDNCELWIDVDKIDKVIFNLLSNAFKFTPKGGIIKLNINTLFNDSITIEVSDSGPGVEQNKIEAIFEPFVQQNQHKSMGTGIGLTLSKGFVDLHKGSLKCIQTESKGALFKMTLPKGRKHFAPNQVVHKSSISQSMIIDENTINADNLVKDFQVSTKKKYHVLIVEDDIELRNYLSKLLGEHYFIKAIENGKLALESIEIENPDIIITDLMMPELDGISMTKILKTKLDTSHLPIIMLTAKSSPEQKIEGIETGADAYIEKPFAPHYLLVRIRKLIDNRKALQDYYKQNIGTSNITRANCSGPDKQFLSKLHTILESNYIRADFSIEEFGKQLGLSRIHLYRKTKALTGNSPTDYVNKYRLQKAKILLSEHNNNIAGIALEVGFSSATYFTKKFKAEYNITPSQFME